MDRFSLGKNPYVRDDNDIQLADVFSPIATADLPYSFGVSHLNWGMLGNDEVGDCLVASAAHEVMAEAYAAGRNPVFSTKNVLQSYAAWTGYVPGDSSTDQGTDPTASAKNRQVEGVLDAAAHGHRIGAYAFDTVGDYDVLLAQVFAFGGTTLCFDLPRSAEEAFFEAERLDEIPVWDYVSGSPIEGGHAVAGTFAAT